MPNHERSSYVGQADACRLLGCNPPWLYRQVRAGRIPARELPNGKRGFDIRSFLDRKRAVTELQDTALKLSATASAIETGRGAFTLPRTIFDDVRSSADAMLAALSNGKETPADA
jgi:hypothetical protein